MRLPLRSALQSWQLRLGQRQICKAIPVLLRKTGQLPHSQNTQTPQMPQLARAPAQVTWKMPVQVCCTQPASSSSQGQSLHTKHTKTYKPVCTGTERPAQSQAAQPEGSSLTAVMRELALSPTRGVSSASRMADSPEAMQASGDASSVMLLAGDSISTFVQSSFCK